MATTLAIIANNEGSGKLTVKAPNLSTNGEVILPSSGTVGLVLLTLTTNFVCLILNN